MSRNVAGVVILYNPEITVLHNILSYSQFLDKLFVVDNSEEKLVYVSDFLKEHHPSAEYILLGGNKGIAAALNIAASKAYKEGYKWLLMMDQDSAFASDMASKLIHTTQIVTINNAGIIAPRYISDEGIPSDEEIEDAFTVITSGSLLNLGSYNEMGPFREDLFIDFVDHEYCLRLKQRGFKILINNSIKLHHQLGNLSCHKFFGWKLCTSNHNYLRRYYITRNRLEILSQFKNDFSEYLATEKNKNFVEMVKVLFLEKDKYKKLKSFFLGYYDFKRGKFGKYDYK